MGLPNKTHDIFGYVPESLNSAIFTFRTRLNWQHAHLLSSEIIRHNMSYHFACQTRQWLTSLFELQLSLSGNLNLTLSFLQSNQLRKITISLFG